MILSKDKVYRLVHPNVVRTCLAIQNKHPTGLIFLLPTEEEYEQFENNGFSIKTGRRFIMYGVDCYKGGFYVASDTDSVDVRVLEL